MAGLFKPEERWDSAIEADPTGWSQVSRVARDATGLNQEDLADAYNDWIDTLPLGKRNPHQFKAFLAGTSFGAAKMEMSVRRVLRDVLEWAEQRCPCNDEKPNPCPLCGASVENLEPCKSAENTLPRWLLSDMRFVLARPDRPTQPMDARGP